MPEMFYDEEFMVKDVEALYKAQLNTEIGLINTEKGAVSGDVLFLDDIPNDKYIFETLDNKALNNYTGFFLMYGIVDTPVQQAQENNYIEELTITVQLGTFDKGEAQRRDTLYKLLRYRRALKNVVMKNPDVFRGYAKPLIKSLKPDVLPYSSRNVIITIGVDIFASATTN